MTEDLLSCQPRVTVASCFVYKVIMAFSLIDHLFINPNLADMINTHMGLSIGVSSSGVHKLNFT